MLQFIQFLKGYVCIRVWGYSPERFMNLCSNHDIFLWDIKNCGEYYSMCVTISGFYMLKGIVKKTGTKVAIQKRCGLPFLVPKIMRRKIFLFGLIGSLVFWMWMSTFIWAVDVTGNYSISEDVFMDFLKQYDVYVGMRRRDVNIEELEKRIRQDFNIVTWTSAKIEGTRLVIQIKENEVDLEADKGNGENEGNGAGKADAGKRQAGKETGNEFGSDLVAGEDGQIVSMVTRAGVPQTAVGAEVKKGDVLVAGSVPVYNEDATIRKYQYYDADADVFISRSLQRTEELPLSYEKKEYTGEEKKEFFIAFMGKEFYLRMGKVKYENYDKVTDRKQVKLLDNFYLPVYYGSSLNREYVLTDNIYTKEEVKNIFSEKLIKFISDLEEKGVQIMKKNVTIEKKDKKWQMNMELQIVEQTGKNVPVAPVPQAAEEGQSGDGTETAPVQ